MHIQLANELQQYIAMLLYTTHDPEKIRQIVAMYGADAVTVVNMMLASHYDTKMETDLAELVISKIKKGI